MKSDPFSTFNVIVGGLCVLIPVVCVQIGNLIIAWKRYHDEKLREEEKKQIQIEQRDCLRQIEVGQTQMNGHLTLVDSMSKTYHEELLRAFQTNCRHSPAFVKNANECPTPKNK